MKMHANAPFGPKGRLTMVGRVIEQGWSLTEAAEAAGVSERTCSKWIARYRAEGEAGLLDRSSAPKTVANRTSERRIEAIAALRRLRMTGAEIAECLGMALSTVSGILADIGLGKLSRLGPPEPPNRYERSRPGELIHIDIKKLGRIGKNGPGHRVRGTRQGTRSRGAGCLEGRTVGKISTSGIELPHDLSAPVAAQQALAEALKAAEVAIESNNERFSSEIEALWREMIRLRDNRGARG